MAHEALLAALDQRRESARRMGGEAKLAKRRERGQLNAEERLAALVDQGSFLEVGLPGASAVFEEDVPRTPRDSKLTGSGRLDGRDRRLVLNELTTTGHCTKTQNPTKQQQHPTTNHKKA